MGKGELSISLKWREDSSKYQQQKAEQTYTQLPFPILLSMWNIDNILNILAALKMIIKNCYCAIMGKWQVLFAFDCFRYTCYNFFTTD